jgi:hypothetical protein
VLRGRESVLNERPRSTPMCAEAHPPEAAAVLAAAARLTPEAFRQDVSLKGARLAFLMTVAHLRNPPGSPFADLHRAAARPGHGGRSMPRTNAKGRLGDPTPSTPTPFLKYSPDQPRVPAGNGRVSGQWTDDSGGTVSPTVRTRPSHVATTRVRRPSVAGTRAPVRPTVTPTPSKPNASADREGVGQPHHDGATPTLAGGAVAVGARGLGLDLGTLSRPAIAALSRFVAGLAPATAVGATVAVAAGFGLALLPILLNTPRGRRVSVPGPGDISVFQDPTTPGVTFRYTTAEGVQEEINVAPDPGGNFRDPRSGKVFARLVRMGTALKVLINTATLLRSRGAQLCTNPAQENHGLKGREYEDYVKAHFNPGNPTPSGIGYAFPKLRNANPVTFDDCRKRNGDLAEYKGPGFEKSLIRNNAAWWGPRVEDDSSSGRPSGGGQACWKPAHILVLRREVCR